MIHELSIILAASLVIDVILKDPRWLYHPVQAIGLTITWIEKVLRYFFTHFLKLAGILLLVITLSIWTLIGYTLLEIASQLSFVLYYAAATYITYSLLAVGALVREAKAVRRYLRDGKISDARARVQEIVSRDMSEEDEKGITRAVIETTTENISDGIVAPIFYFALGGPILMLVYKVVNTLDSMVGYKNEKYRDFGFASAKTDDVLNLVPARITGFLIVAVAFIRGDDYKQSFHVWMRDGQKGPSPNGGIPITAFAGARNIKLGGPCISKEGAVLDIPYVGGEKDQYGLEEIGIVIKYVYHCAWLSVSIVAMAGVVMWGF